MIAVVQRVVYGAVLVDEQIISEIGVGMVVLVSVHAKDEVGDVEWMAGKLAGLRIFRNGDKYFDADVKQCGGSVLLVSNFTVAAETAKGRRPSLSPAAGPDKGRELFDKLVAAVRAQGVQVETGRFQAEMRVDVANDGPVTFIVDSREK